MLKTGEFSQISIPFTFIWIKNTVGSRILCCQVDLEPAGAPTLTLHLLMFTSELLLIRRWKDTDLRASCQNALPASLSDDAVKMVDEEGVVSIKFPNNYKYSFLMTEMCYKTYFML